MLIFITLWELMFVLLSTAYLLTKCENSTKCGIRYKSIILIVSIVCSFIIGGQLSALSATRRYVDVLTLSNIYSYRDVGWKIILSSAFIIFFLHRSDSVCCHYCQKRMVPGNPLAVCCLLPLFLVPEFAGSGSEFRQDLL